MSMGEFSLEGARQAEQAFVDGVVTELLREDEELRSFDKRLTDAADCRVLFDGLLDGVLLRLGDDPSDPTACAQMRPLVESTLRREGYTFEF